MGGRRPLKARAPRLLGKHDGAAGRAYSRNYQALAAELGPFDRPLLRFEAGRVALAMLNVEVASRALATARRTREQGTGRRPSARDLERLSRRQALQDQSYSQALDRLRTLVAGNGHAHRVPTPAELLAGLQGAPRA
jgi:hypothetical protein